MSSVTKRPNRPVPAYLQIESRLRHKIHQGDWRAGTMLPSRRDLAKEYGVSSLTVDRAITRLIADGLLRADDRRGTFVTTPEDLKATPADILSSAPAAEPHLAGHAVVIADGPTRSATASAPGLSIGILATLHLSRSDHVELNNFWVRLILQSLEHAFSEEGKTTRFYNRVQSPPGQPLVPLRNAIAELAAEGVDAIAIIALDVNPQEVDEGLSALDSRKLPVVCVTLGELRRPVPHLFYENRSAGYQATEHLLRRGCREILFLAPFTASWVKERLEGVQAAVEHARLPAKAVQIFPRRSGAWVQEEDPEVLGYTAAQDAFKNGLVRSGVVCANDGVALGFLRAGAEAGLVAGSDYALVSFDDHPDARIAGLTTLRPPMEMLGKETARLLMRALQGEMTDLQVRLRSHLIPRKSSRIAHQ